MSWYSGIYGWIVGLVAVIAAGVSVYVKGRRDGQVKSDAEKLRNTIAVQERTNDVLQKSKNVVDDVSNLSSHDAEQRLRDKYTRD